jgi:SOS-response transcriptional repressor LexA
MKKIGEFLKEKREARRMSLREVSKITDISHVHIKDIEDGKSMPAFDKVMELLRTYMVGIDEFLRETRYLPPTLEPVSTGIFKRVPVLSWTQAGNWREMTEQTCEEYVETDAKGLFALKVIGDSMEPEFYEGDIIVVNPHLKQEHNDYIVVASHEGEATFKQLKKYGKKRILHPLNPKYPDIELDKEVEYRIIGVVVEKKKRYR